MGDIIKTRMKYKLYYGRVTILAGKAYEIFAYPVKKRTDARYLAQ